MHIVWKLAQCGGVDVWAYVHECQDTMLRKKSI